MIASMLRRFPALRWRPICLFGGCLGLLVSGACATVAANPTRYRHPAQPFQISFDRDGYILDEQGSREGSEVRLEEVTREINRAAESTGAHRPVVLLIHGTSPGIPAYQLMEDQFQREYFPEGDVVFVEIYWPGGQFGRDRHPWGFAQHNSYGAGLGVRRVLNRINADVPVRILTHSMGGGVAAGALWNVVSKVQTNRPSLLRWRQEYLAAIDSIPTPALSDIRVAMLVPSIPGCTFDDFRRPAPAVDPFNYALEAPSALGCGFGSDSIHSPVLRPNIRRIVIGYSPNDLVIEKGLRACRWVGVSCLGSRYDEFERYVEPVGRFGTEVVAVQITTRPELRQRRGLLATEAHWFIDYVQNPNTRRVFDLLFRDPPQ